VTDKRKTNDAQYSRDKTGGRILDISIASKNGCMKFKIMTEKTYLVDMEGIGPYAQCHGALFDETLGRWYVEGDVPNELWGLLPKSLDKPLPEDTAPLCPFCSVPMRLVVNSTDKSVFWGCSNYYRSNCHGSRPYAGEVISSEKSSTSIDSHLNNVFSSIRKKNNHQPKSFSECASMTHAQKQLLVVELLSKGRSRYRTALWLTTPQPRFGMKIPTILLLTEDGCNQLLFDLLT
jgi:hypothetical protein